MTIEERVWRLSRRLRRPYKALSNLLVQPLIDRHLGVDTASPSPRLHVEPGAGHEHDASGWRALRRAFALLDAGGITPADGLVDLGCGKGRALVLAARRPFGRVTGVEAAPELAAVAEQNAKVLRPRMRARTLEVVTADARDYRFPPDITVAFMFNPFGRAVMGMVLENLAASLAAHPRRFRVLYSDPLAEPELVAAGFEPRGGFKTLVSRLRVELYEKP